MRKWFSNIAQSLLVASVSFVMTMIIYIPISLFLNWAVNAGIPLTPWNLLAVWSTAFILALIGGLDTNEKQ